MHEFDDEMTQRVMLHVCVCMCACSEEKTRLVRVEAWVLYWFP